MKNSRRGELEMRSSLMYILADRIVISEVKNLIATAIRGRSLKKCFSALDSEVDSP